MLYIGVFPEADKDPVIQIGNTVQIQGERDPFLRVVFTLNTCAPIIGSQVLSFQKESDMLAAWARFVAIVDPDIVTGMQLSSYFNLLGLFYIHSILLTRRLINLAQMLLFNFFV